MHLNWINPKEREMVREWEAGLSRGLLGTSQHLREPAPYHHHKVSINGGCHAAIVWHYASL